MSLDMCVTCHNKKTLCRISVWFVGFYGISTFVGYLMPNPFVICQKTFLFQTIQADIFNNSV